MEDIEGAGQNCGKKKTRFYGRLQRHIDIATAIAGDVPQWITAFLERMFNDMVFNFTLNSYLDGTDSMQGPEAYFPRSGDYQLHDI